MLLAQQYNVMFNPGGPPGPTATPTATPLPASFVETLNDPFDDDYNYEEWGGMGSSCAVSTGVLTAPGSGLCHYPIAGGERVGTHPTTHNHWAAAKFSSTNGDSFGVAVRVKSSDPGGGDYNYVGRCSGGAIQLRVCHSGDNCADLGAGGTCNNTTNSKIALMVAGTEAATELCGWSWASAADEGDWSDPATWKTADFCVAADTTLNLLDDVAADEDVDVWAGGGPGTLRGWPDTGNTNISLYSGIGQARDWDWLRGGDIP
jgi:hypothetical protein